ncbi:dihydroorotate dehydrogenase [Candidatus Parcubacteria bacterium]|jgi:dihydroorotate dehydrogenase (NAD+) catalytic subunit|nr:dihydroorotate dehydrogenase [Candidatus Parcubacteria bacterium]MBT3949405.1 dihydroorotate dehydrogenase [Candidatus Parcubacteria bacterium]
MLETSFLAKKFSNPTVLASGILGVTGAGMNRVIDQGCGGITIKSVSLEPRTGHPNPTMIGQKHFFINAVGLSNPGVIEAIEEIKKFRTLSNAPIIASVFAGTPEEFGEVTKQICEAPINFLEVNISCPNVSTEFGDPFAYSIPAVQIITKKVKENANVPVIIKLTPQAWNVAEIAKAAESAGADAICAGNTISGMIIDVRSRKPILHNKQGGVSGPALFPVALKAVYDIYKTVNIPIIGTGGITTGEDALAMIMAGATLLGVGSAVYYEGEEVFKKITDEMEVIMNEEGIQSLEEIRGAAHT